MNADLRDLTDSALLRELHRVMTIILATQEHTVAQIDDLRQSIQTLQTEVQENGAVLDQLRALIVTGPASLQAQLDEARAQLSALQATDQAEKAALEETLAGLTSQVEAAAAALDAEQTQGATPDTA